MYDNDNLKHQKKVAEVYAKYKKSNKFDYLYKSADELNEYFKEDLKMEGWRSRYRRLEDEYKEMNSKITHKYNHNNDIEERLVTYLNQERTIDFLIEKLDMSEMELKGYIFDLQIHGREISISGDRVKLAKSPIKKDTITKINFKGCEEFEVLVLGDNHFGNTHQQKTYTKEAYKEAERRGVKFAINTGDITDGQSNRPEQIYENFLHGADAQSQYVIDNYPKAPFPTYLLLGNHDGWFMKAGGTDIGKIISAQRPDIIYIGSGKARLEFGNLKIDVIHPGDGSNRTVSQALQTAASIIDDNNKPNILVSGHHHRYAHFIERGIHCFECPALEGRTSFMTAKHLVNTMGYMFWKIKVDKKGNLISITDEPIIKYEEILNDYVVPTPTLKQKSFKI